MRSVPLVVLIPTHGRPVLLQRTLDSLAACALPEGYRETVVVENGSRAGAEAVVAEVAAAHRALRLRYLHVERANKSAALNAALATVDDEALCIMIDDDIRMDPSLLIAYSEAYSINGSGAFYGGPCKADYEVEPDSAIVPFLPASAKETSLDRLMEKRLFLGFNWAASAGMLKHAGGFNPLFGPGSPGKVTGQESEMQHRLLSSGFRMEGVRQAVVWHYVPAERSSQVWLRDRIYRVGKSAGLAWQGGMFRGCGQAIVGLGRHALATVWYRTRTNGHASLSHRLAFSRQLGFLFGVMTRAARDGNLEES